MRSSWLLILGTWLSIGSSPGSDRHVGAGRDFPSIAAALLAAAPGDRLLIHGGRWAETPIRITKPLELVGLNGAVVDARGAGEGIVIEASDVTVRGFEVCQGGRSSTNDLAGIRVESGRRVRIEDNRVIDCSFGIYLGRARDCRVIGNRVQGKPDRQQNSGNGVHLWSCEGIAIEGNAITGHRDGIYLEFASHSTVERNRVEQNLRYGLHFMSSHDSAYRANRFVRNGAGVAVMYSRQVEMVENSFEYNWGSSAYGLLLKDITDSRIADNAFDHNSTAIYAQGATRVSFERNQFLRNGWALRILSSGAQNVLERNTFQGNTFDIGTNGQLSEHRFANNYWDRYEGYDLNRDGVGDVPFRPASLYAMIVERVPASMLLSHSFMVQLLDRAERAFPSITPDTVIDEVPALRPWASPPALAWLAPESSKTGAQGKEADD